MKLLLADDHHLFRESMQAWLQQADIGACISAAASYDEVIARLSSEDVFDLVMLDLNMPGMNGVLSVPDICAQTTAPVLVVSANHHPVAIQICLTNGAAGYVSKASDGASIIEAIHTLLDGGTYAPANMKQASDLPRFTEKKLQILLSLAKGKSNREIAKTLHLSEGSVKQYVSEMLRKLQVDNRTQACIKARDILATGGS